MDKTWKKMYQLAQSAQNYRQISATSNEAIYGESNKSTMLSTVSFIAEILVSLSLFVSNAIMKWAGNLKVMFFVSAAYFSIVLLIMPLIKQKE
ncbi:hypothetical protein U2F58_01700 [Lactobacillus johnsonii]|uniref:hypothetical protein n=1 Tax=Lactobacillus johnsonii TaxID=33959 RepID=UPI002622F21D